MQGVIAGLLTSIDVFGLYILMPSVKSRILLSLWTASLHMLFPFLGFELGNWILQFLLEWAKWISSILLFCVGLQLLLSSNAKRNSAVSPLILAVIASLDTFSVSISFGMLNLEKTIFIVSAGISAFACSYIALVIARRSKRIMGTKINIVAGIVFIIMSIWTMT
ncbi:MAG: manganese efflux pump [Lysinibacillus sp.]